MDKPEQITDLDELVGKTVKDAFDSSDSSGIIISFTDNTFIVISGENGWHDSPPSIYTDKSWLSISGSDANGNKDGIRLGLFTQKYVDKAVSEWIKECEEDRRKRDIEALNKLKEKYPDA